MSLEIVQPRDWKPPKGYSNGVIAPAGSRLLFVAGQIAWDEKQVLVGRGDFVLQFRKALENVLAVLRAAQAAPSALVELTIFVTDKQAYSRSTAELGAIWKELVGRHYPAMALVEVAALLEDGAQVEIRAVAAIR